MTSSDWLPTACILCECNCGIVVQVDDRRLARIRGDKAHPGSAGYTCNKALRLDHYQNNRARLSSPMRRRADGTYEEIDWDTAIVEIAEGFKQIRDTHGGDKIFYYGGGGQGNHLGGAYSGAFLKALGSRYRSNALAQEKTGEAWVDFQLYGGHTRGEFENAEVSVFVGKNPWMSQSFPRARVVLNEIAKDPGRSMIVIDPVVTDTAKMADFHLRVQPGCDAWCLAALAAVLVQENLCNEAFLAAHVHGVDTVRAALQEVPVADYAQRCGVDEELLRAAARRIGTAASVSVFEDLGIQQAPNSTVCSYLNKLLWILTGNFAKKGGQHLHSSFAPLFSQVSGRTPVTGAPIIAGLIPGNVVPEEILTEHPDRFRAMIVERGNPAHSLADSAACRAAFQALELMVVVDVAMTETARLAHYVLPAASQFEKPEATFFNFEFPRNGFQLRRPLFPPLPGTLPEPEIWARLVRALGVVDEADLRPLREAAAQGRQAYTEAFLAAAATNPTVAKLTAYVLPNGRFCVCSRGLSLVPDPDPALRVQKQRVILGDVEGLIKSVHVANHTVAPELRRGVRIDRQPADCFGCTRFGSPYLCPAEEHPLHAGQPVDNRSGVAVQRELVSQQGDRQPAQVADVLAYGERALHMRRAGVVDEIARRVSVVLLDQRFGAGGELGAIVVGPPIDQIAVAVVFGALIVETVPDLVPDHRPDPAVVGGLVGLRIEKWWL